MNDVQCFLGPFRPLLHPKIGHHLWTFPLMFPQKIVLNLHNLGHPRKESVNTNDTKPQIPTTKISSALVLLYSCLLKFDKTIFARKYRINGELRHDEILVICIFFFFYLV
jgi:hypothetical protein